ncbi:hypothetical protein J437_LFUL015467 [Ladona fulva]|uniref:Uncharacterized protein n=1 Tax=Ladona fulva TaxID=123851 RepID=A0A8K0KLN3_LADFU|nr:hypothetical protein J437_LFUL015467 [Ladona fulva]
MPTLVLVDADTGRVITGAGRHHVIHDPEANGFPWRPRPLLTVLSEGALVDTLGSRHNYNIQPEGEVENRDGIVHGLYFSANWVSIGTLMGGNEYA